MSLFKSFIFFVLATSSIFANAYSESTCKKSMDDYEMLTESNELIKISKNIIDIARRLDELKTNSNTDFFVAGLYGNQIGSSGFYLSYALKLMKQVDKTKLIAINNDEVFKNRAMSYANTFDTVLNVVSNYYVVEKNPAARDELGKLKSKLEIMSQKYSSCK